jgi:hypothetical protein
MVNHAFLEKYVDSVLVPAIESNRRLPGCEKEPALLFCDNFGAHCSNDVLTKPMRHGAIAIIYPLLTSHIFQVQDVLLFNVLKRAKKYQKEMIHEQAISITFSDFFEPMRWIECAQSMSSERSGNSIFIRTN